MSKAENFEDPTEFAQDYDPSNDGPVITVNAGIYKYTWDNEGVEIKIDRIRENKGNPAAEITINEAGLVPSLIHQSRITLLSSKGRTEAANQCAKRRNHVDWGKLIEYACITTVEKHREGEPVVVVGNLPSVERSKYLVQPLLQENQANLIYGPGGSCKSYLAVLLCLILQNGLVKEGLQPSRSMNCLYLDYETGKEEINDRIKYLKQGMGFNPGIEFHYRFCHQPVAADIVEIQRIVSEKGIGFVVVDSYAMACGGEPESADVAREYFMALRSLRITSLTIDHVTKENNRGPFGSIYKVNESRNLWEIKGVQEVGEGVTEIGLYHRKSNNSRLFKPLGFRFDFGSATSNVTGVTVTEMEIRNNPELATGAPLQERIAIYLESSGASEAKKIAEEIEVSDNSVRGTLNRYSGKRFKKVGSAWDLI